MRFQPEEQDVARQQESKPVHAIPPTVPTKRRGAVEGWSPERHVRWTTSEVGDIRMEATWLDKPRGKRFIHEGHKHEKQGQQSKAIVKHNWPVCKNNDKKSKTTVKVGVLREEFGAKARRIYIRERCNTNPHGSRWQTATEPAIGDMGSRTI